VWRALTEAAELERWFPLEARVQPGAGGAMWLSWKNEFASELEILAWEPGRHLRTGWRFHAHDGDLLVTDYRLEPEDDGTVVRVVTSGFPSDAAWDDWIEGTARGWRFELVSLKRYLEASRGRTRHVLYVRRRVALAADEAWARLLGPDGLGPRPLAGRPLDEAPPRQWAGDVDDPPGGLFRASIEPTGLGSDERDVTLWLQAWGARPPRFAALEAEWPRMLESLYPEGRAV